jgi:hypothetical protein
MGLDDGVRADMVREVDAFLQDLLTGNRSVLTLVNADYAFVNKRMATYYGIPFPGTDANAFVQVPSPANRKGIVTSAAIMTNTAGEVTFTHAVHRGKWITSQILCAEPAPPPPNVPPIDPNPNAGGTPRQKLEAHVNNPECIGCHKVMDAVGFGVENYDPFGKWRDAYPGTIGRVDASGSLPDGKSFTTPLEMFDDLAQGDQTRACLARHLLAYAVTRAMTSSDDMCVSQAIGKASITPTGTFSDVLNMIVGSRQFLMQTGEAQ